MSKNNIPLLSILYNVANHNTLSAKFKVCEELIFDLFSLSEEDKAVIRNESNNDVLMERLSKEVSSLSMPGKVSMRVEGELSPSLGLIYNLLHNEQVKSDFLNNRRVENETVSDEAYTYRDIAFHSFNVTNPEAQSKFVELLSDSKRKSEAIDYLCEEIKKELKSAL